MKINPQILTVLENLKKSGIVYPELYESVEQVRRINKTAPRSMGPTLARVENHFVPTEWGKLSSRTQAQVPRRLRRQFSGNSLDPC